jgi:predicted HicB family RNase H-like nuclease
MRVFQSKENAMIDKLGHPITVGATVLTNGYYTSSMNTVTTIEKVTEKAVYVIIDANSYDYANSKYTYTKKLMRRIPDQIIVIDKQLNYNKKTYPEYQI